MTMQQPPCKNTLKYFRSCCSPIGQNYTKDVSAQSGGSIGRPFGTDLVTVASQEPFLDSHL